MPKREVKGTPEAHRKFFPEFVDAELMVGGPDPHMKICKWIVDHDSSIEDVPWFVGCYIGPYVVSTGEVIHHHWPTSEEVLRRPKAFTNWIHNNYHRLELRKERRAILGAPKFSEYMLGYARWANEVLPGLGGADFETAWNGVRQVRGNGRYGSMKLYEALRVAYGVPAPEFPDIRPDEGWSPRLALSWLQPEYAEWLNGSYSRSNNILSQTIATAERDWLATEQKLNLDWFNFEVMLCDYKQAYDGRQYPGRAHDSELGRGVKIESHFPTVPLQMWQARFDLFPIQALGEHNGWGGRRDLGSVIHDYGYTWSDIKYDYDATEDLARPVRRG